VTVTDARGSEVGIAKHVQQGKTTIKVTRAGVSDSDKLRDLDLKRPIYLVKEGKFGKTMRKLAACLIMDPDDFQAIEQSVHAGAFGSDYENVLLDIGSGKPEKWIVLWKLAADLNGINGYQVVPVPQDVGTYAMTDDWQRIPLNPIHIDKQVTKMRYDFQHGAEFTSVHHMELESNPDIRFSTISTDKFFEDFYQIDNHTDEMARVQEMVETLDSKAKIKSFLCNSQQHQIVFYEDAKSGEILTPVKFAAILNKGDDRANVVKGAIRKALAERGYGGATYTSAANDARFETWVKDYIETFDSTAGKVGK
jgi:predicted GNAT family acetyltransferase